MRALFVILLMLAIAGCDGPETTLRKTVLSKLGMAYHAFYAKENRTPVNVDEMEAYLRKQNQDTNAVAVLIQPLRNGEVLFVWQGRLSQDGEVNDQFLLGYEKDTPKSGGFMVTGGGFVQHVTPEEFARYKPLPSGPMLIPSGQ